MAMLDHHYHDYFAIILTKTAQGSIKVATTVLKLKTVTP